MSDQEKRKPLLSAEQAINIAMQDATTFKSVGQIIDGIRNFYEAKITSGELIVAKPPPPHRWSCSACGELIARELVGRKLEWPRFCPECGKRRQDVGGTCSRPVYA